MSHAHFNRIPHLASWQELIVKGDARAAAMRKRRWDEWVDQVFSEQGDAKVFRFIRGPAVPTVAAQIANRKGELLDADTGPQALIESRCDFLEDLWCPRDLLSSHAALPAELRELPVPLPTADELFPGLAPGRRP